MSPVEPELEPEPGSQEMSLVEPMPVLHHDFDKTSIALTSSCMWRTNAPYNNITRARDTNLLGHTTSWRHRSLSQIAIRSAHCGCERNTICAGSGMKGK